MTSNNQLQQKRAATQAKAPQQFSSLRIAMTWLHTWSGLWAGWILFAIFFTGTLGVFDAAITQWMKPEQPAIATQPQTTAERQQALNYGQSYLQKISPRSHFWSIGLPTEEEPAIRIFWQDADENFQSGKLDPVTGELIPKSTERNTEGGHHFVHMHYEFHAGTAGVWLVGFFAMAMLAALVSGVIIHKRIFADFFTFRRGKAQRSWLDAHNATAVLTLPFQLMITYTGLAIFFALYMPAAISANYKTSENFFADLFAQPAHREETHIAAPVVQLAPILATAEARLERRTSFVVVEHPGDSSAVITVHGPFDEGKDEKLIVTPNGGRMMFDAVSGAEMDTVLPRMERGGPIWMVQQVMAALHMATFGGYTLKWLYFICGMAGAAMMATGSIMFMVKRRKKSGHEFGSLSDRLYNIIDSLNVAAIAGLMLACIAYLWINRLIPLAVEERAAWEIRAFFAVWVSAFIHAGLRSSRRAWLEQLAVAAILCLALPLINLLTTGEYFMDYLLQQEWLRLSVELTCIACGLLLVFALWKLNSAPATAKPVRTKTARATASAIPLSKGSAA